MVRPPKLRGTKMWSSLSNLASITIEPTYNRFLVLLLRIIMAFKGIVNMYRRGVETKHVHIAPECSSRITESSSHSQWASLPPELLLDIIQRVEASETSWPSRGALVACATVCKSWREVTKGVVMPLEQCGMLIFPISLKQPGPRDTPIQCFIKRDRDTSTYSLYLGLTPALSGDRSKLLLTAKEIRKATCTEFIISLVADDFSKANNTYIGKLRSNFLGTKFMIFDGHPPRDSSLPLCSKLTKVLPKDALATAIYKVAKVSYNKLNVLHISGPRRIKCTMNLIPRSSVKEGGTAPTPLEFSNYHNEHESSKGNKPEVVVEFGSTCTDFEREPLVLKSKAPRWNEQLHCWCLNFKGRVTVASVKNFQLIIVAEPWQLEPEAEQEKVILQFGKIGRDIFTMDYEYPLSAFHAFAICLSSFDSTNL